MASSRAERPPKAGPAVSLTRGFAVKSTLSLTCPVADAGPGLPEGAAANVFNRFYSERPEGEAFGTHSGLGLSIARQIVEAHGGHISGENHLAPDGSVAGARFTVDLPT